MSEVVITQADRDAAQRWGTGPVYNMDHLAEAFARRAQAEREALKAWIEGRPEYQIPVFKPGLRLVVDAIFHGWSSEHIKGAGNGE